MFQETVLHRDIQTQRRELKYDAQRGIWLANETRTVSSV